MDWLTYVPIVGSVKNGLEWRSAKNAHHKCYEEVMAGTRQDQCWKEYEATWGPFGAVILSNMISIGFFLLAIAVIQIVGGLPVKPRRKPNA
jgi:hypothetical protein